MFVSLDLWMVSMVLVLFGGSGSVIEMLIVFLFLVY